MSDLVNGQNKPKLKIIIKKKVIKWGIFLLAIIGIAMVLVNWESHYVQTDHFCAKCHLNSLHFETRASSSHAKFSCGSCHLQWQKFEPTDLKQISREVYKQFIPYPLPELLVGKYRIADGVCLNCHTFARDVTPSGDLIIPHKNHSSKRVQCISCHSGLVHGDKNHLGITKTPALDNSETVRESPENTPPMGLCMNCHRRRQVTLDCEACHTDMKLPEAHLSPDFKRNHGLQAREELSTCDTCHQYSASSAFLVQNRKNVVEYARLNPFCGDCHAKMPPSHLQQNFMFKHGSTGEIATCLTCHNNNPGTGQATTATQCNSCHYQSHSLDWQKKHLIPIRDNADWAIECYTCHAKNSCEACHRR